jgi:hypothetical protein
MTRRPTRSPIAAVSLSESPDSRTSRKICISSPWHKHGKRRQRALSSLLCVALLAISACHSYHIDATIVNRTGMPVHLLEVDYPDASFGADIIASGASFHYRFQIRGSGALKITYTGADNKQIQITGPTLDERQQGQLRIILLPAGKAQFLPKLSSPS